MRMRIFYLSLLTLTTWTISHAQDGSDILYCKQLDRIDKVYIGDFAHLDFYRRSFGGRTLDTVTLVIDGRSIKFVEHREDNGYNNWFSRQYLESLDKTDAMTARIVKFRLDNLTSDSIIVTGYLEYYREDKIVPDKSKEIVLQFSRNMIVEVLVSADSHNERKR